MLREMRHLPVHLNAMLRTIDSILDRITMYRLVLYSLIGLLCVSVLGSLVGQIPYTGLSILFSSLFLAAIVPFLVEILSGTRPAKTPETFAVLLC
jgi:hypothetical protein